MEPEIARRCVACGAAVRGRAQSCPQCGQEIDTARTLGRVGELASTTQHEERRSTDVEKREPPSHQSEGAPPASVISAARNEEQTHKAVITDESQRPHALPVSTQPFARIPEAQSRLSERSVRDNEGATHERAATSREDSTRVMDETTDDPGVRFVLIACALFALFVVILIFSFILR